MPQHLPGELRALIDDVLAEEPGHELIRLGEVQALATTLFPVPGDHILRLIHLLLSFQPGLGNGCLRSQQRLFGRLS